MRFPALLLVAPLALASCLFDGAVPAGVAIACAADDDCPGADVCVVGRCAPVEALRGEAPVPADVVVTPAVVGRGGTLTVTFSVAAPLGAPPVVALEAGRIIPLDVISGGPGVAWVFSRTIDGSEVGGTATLSITLVDGLGRATTTPAGTVVIDLVAPVFAEATPIVTLARQGTTIGVDALLDAPAAARGAVLLGDGTTVPMDVILEGLRVRARVTVDERFASGRVGLVLGARDDGGNDSGDVPVGDVIIDLDAPTVTLQTPPATVRPRDLVRFIATASEVVVAPPLTIDGSDITADVDEGAALSWSWLVPDDAADRVVSVAPGVFVDLAGNERAVAAVPVRVDGTAPVLAVDVAPAAQARAGETIAATFHFDEPVAAVAVEAQRFDDVVAIPVVAEGGTFRFDVSAGDFASQGRYDLIVTASDVVGNESRQLLGAVVVDALAPLLVSAAFTPAAGRLGSTVTLQLTFSEPIRQAGNGVDVEFESNTSDLQFVGVAGNTVTYTLVVNDGTPPLVQVTRLTATDLAGNTSVIDVGDTLKLTVDNIAPRLTNLSPLARRVQRKDGGSIVVVGNAVDPDGTVAPRTTATFAGRTVACNTDVTAIRCEIPVTATDDDGPQSVEIAATDQAGNVTTETVVVTLDGAGPEVVNLAFSAEKARPGTLVQLTLIADEPIASLGLSLSTGQVVLTPGRASVVQTITMPASDLVVTAASLTDDLGNVRSLIFSDTRVIADGAPPDIVGSAVSTNRVPGAARAGDAVIVDVDVDLPLLEAPTISFGATPMEIIGADDAGHFTARRVLLGTETEGATIITVTAVDDVGNVGFSALATPVVVDFTPPALIGGTVQMSVSPRPGSPVLSSGVVGIGGQARVSFLVSELLFDLPTIELAGAAVATQVDMTGTGITLRLDSTQLGDGSQPVRAVVEDRVGNVATIGVTTIQADLVPPAALSTVELGLLTHVRAPHGSVTSPTPFHRVISAGTMAGRQGQTLTVALDAAETLRVGVGQLADDPLEIVLDRDFESVFLQIYDEAGNKAAGPSRRPRTEFIAGLNGKIAGSLTSNPHRIELRRHFTTVPFDGSAEELNGDVLAQRDGVGLTVEPEGIWQESGPQPPPSARHRVASTTHQETTYLFGGCGAEGPSDESWLFDGRAWKALVGQKPDRPPARCGAVLVSDGERLHLIGGEGTSGLLDDHWIWDGLNWKQLIDRLPTATSEMAGAFDAAAGVIVIYGGVTGGGVSGSILRLPPDGEVWEDLGEGPARAAAASAVLDDGTLLVVGGIDQRAEFSASVLAVAGGSATEVQTLPRPMARGCAVGRGLHAIVLGGVTDSGALTDVLRVARDRVDVELPPLTLPTARSSAGCGRVEAELLLFGGTVDGVTFLPDTLRASSEGWRPIEAATDLPSGRSHAAAAKSDDTFYLFGGTVQGSATDEVWELFEVWKPTTPLKSPVERAGAACIRELCWVVGGADETGARVTSGQRWPRDGSGSAVVSHIGLTPRTNPAVAADGTGALLLFGGLTAVGLSGETCVSSKAEEAADELAWDCRVRPGPPASAGAVMLEDKGQVILYAAGQVWRWLGDQWEASRADVRPPPRQFPAIAIDGTVLWLHGGVSGATRFDDLWAWDMGRDQWREQAPADPFDAGAPDARAAHALHYDPRLQRLVLFGGENATSKLGDMWDFIPGEQAQAGVNVTVDFESAIGFSSLSVQAFGPAVSIAGGEFSQDPTALLPVPATGEVRMTVPIVGAGQLVLDAVDLRLIRP